MQKYISQPKNSESIYFEAQPFTYGLQNKGFRFIGDFNQVYYPTNYSHLPEKSIQLMKSIVNTSPDLFVAESNYCSVHQALYEDNKNVNYDLQKPVVLSQHQKFNQAKGQDDDDNYKVFAASAFYGNLYLK
jgi:hypothetical protein